MNYYFSDIAEPLLKNGYHPIPVVAGDKRPAIADWTNINYKARPELLQELRARFPRASTGVLLGAICVLDIDVLDPETADRCRDLVTARLGQAPCRFGKHPKAALFFRVDGAPFKKMATKAFVINGLKAQVEILCEGQQVVVFGDHPDTKKPYHWEGESPLTVPVSGLPSISVGAAEELIKALEMELSSRADTGSIQTNSPKSMEGRNGFLFSRGCALRAGGADQADVRAELQALNSRASVADHPNFADGPLGLQDVEAIVSSVMRYAAGPSSGLPTDLLQELNARHAVVLVGGKCAVVNQFPSAGGRYREVTFSTPTDIANWYANVLIGQGKNRTSAGKAWLAHPERRQYQGLVFAPGKETPGFLNLYQGFAVEPKRGDCSLLQDHIKNNICRSDDEVHEYLLAWLADCVQNKRERPGVAVVLRGRQGTGKSIFCEEFGKLFGPHFIHVTHANHLTGNFNSHLANKVVVYADEAFWAGDRKAEGVLKAMITEPTQQIELKGKDVITVENHIRLMISSNHNWVIPAGAEERRFFVIDVGDGRIQDTAYFGALVRQMEEGGREAFLQFLLDYDLSGIDLRRPPSTSALEDQKMHSASPIQAWWRERLQDGAPTSITASWAEMVSTAELYEDYLKFCGEVGRKHRASQSIFGRELKGLIPNLIRGRSPKKHSRQWVYILPPLDECRRQHDLLNRTKTSWVD